MDSEIFQMGIPVLGLCYDTIYSTIPIDRCQARDLRILCKPAIKVYSSELPQLPAQREAAAVTQVDIQQKQLCRVPDAGKADLP